MNYTIQEKHQFKKLWNLAKQAEFNFWEQDESWNPGDVIDWAARYDDELIQLYNLIVHEAAEVCNRVSILEQDHNGKMYANAIIEYFKNNFDAKI